MPRRVAAQRRSWLREATGPTPGVAPALCSGSTSEHLESGAHSDLFVFKLDTIRQSLLTRIYSGPSPMDQHVDTNNQNLLGPSPMDQHVDTNNRNLLRPSPMDQHFDTNKLTWPKLSAQHADS